jgi:hypothetical protein
MASVPRMISGLADYTLADLEALENERPELGRLEIIDGALHATGESAVGDLHQLVVQRLHLLFAPLCPATHIIRLDTWWESERGKIRPDLAIYRPADRPPNRKAFQVPPWATLEVLSDDADHDLRRKDAVYADFGVAHRGYVEPWGRFEWWCRLDGVEHAEPTATWRLPGWPPIDVERDVLLVD